VGFLLIGGFGLVAWFFATEQHLTIGNKPSPITGKDEPRPLNRYFGPRLTGADVVVLGITPLFVVMRVLEGQYLWALLIVLFTFGLYLYRFTRVRNWSAPSGTE
jgi:hypothetical protein